MTNDIVKYQDVITDIKGIISSGREDIYNAVNKTMVLTYWHVGKRIVEQEQAGKERAKYGQFLIETLADELTKEYGKSFSKRNLQYFRKFYLDFPNEQIVNTCVHNLNWSHFRTLLRVPDENARMWYMNEAANESWSVRTLDRNISTQYYYKFMQSPKEDIVIHELMQKSAENQKNKFKRLKSPIVEEFLEIWNQAHRKRQETGVLQVKTHSLQHEHILSGIIKCPVCGSSMYGNVNRKKHSDGSYYKDYFYYACKHRKLVDGLRCTYKKQWNEDRVNAAVEEIVRKFVKNPKFEQEIRKQIGSSINTSELAREYDGLKDRLNQTTGAKNRLADQMDHLPVSDKNYDKKYNDMQERLDKLYDEIADIENTMEEVETRLYNIRKDKISEDNIYQFLLLFDKLYDKFTDLEKKTFWESFLSDVFIYEEEQKDGRILKGIRFKNPIYINGRKVLGVDCDNESN